MQTVGFDAFSYADIAVKVGVRKASIHHHFPAKRDLAKSLVERYRERFGEVLLKIEDETTSPPRRLERYFGRWTEVLRDDGRMCLCGMMAAATHSLPRGVREQIRRFVDENEAWLARVLTAGQKTRALRLRLSPAAEARLLFSALEGAMLVARARGDPALFEESTELLLRSISPD